jgi:hypothetical protein
MTVKGYDSDFLFDYNVGIMGYRLKTMKHKKVFE